MTRSRILFTLLLTLALAAGAYAGGFQLNEHGARAMAQAGAFTARAYDGSAIYFNPAGLAFQKNASIYLGTTLITPTTSFYGPLQNNTNIETKQMAALFTPINAYGTYPITEDLHVGFGIYNPFGLGTEWPENWSGKFLTTKVSLESFFYTPTVAYKITDQLSLGVGANFATGKVVIERAVATGFGDPRVKLEMDGNGWGFNLGALYKITPEISIGATYRSQVKVEAKGTATFTPPYSVLPSGPSSVKITLPATGYLGIAYKGENFEVEADYQYIGWSSYQELAIQFEANGQMSVSPKNYKDTYILRLGGEYTIDRTHLRAGFYYDHSPVQTEYVEPLLPDASRNGYNIGLGYDISSSLSVDVAYLFIAFQDRKAENTIPEINFDGTYKTYANLFAINFGYRF